MMFSKVEVGLQTGRLLLVGLEEILEIEAGFGSPHGGGTHMGEQRLKGAVALRLI
jgi:hypothetical protein